MKITNQQLIDILDRAIREGFEANVNLPELQDLKKDLENEINAGEVNNMEIEERALDNESDPSFEALKYNEYNFLSANYRELKNAESHCRMILAKTKEDINANVMMAKIQFDLGILSPLVQKLGFELTQMIEKKLNVQFRFLVEPKK